MNNLMPTTTAHTAYDLLTDICKIIKKEPKRLNMSIVCYRGARLDDSEYMKPACGVVGCIAGWSLMLTGRMQENAAIGHDTYDARVVLGLESDQATELFMPDDLIDEDPQTPEHAAHTIEHVKAFQAKYKVQLKAHRIVYKD